MERAFKLLLCALASGVLVFACTVNLGDKKIYSCTAKDDCGGDGFICAIAAGGAIGSCCKPAGAEQCNMVDDDCNGLIDDGFPAETCNGKDDNCNGKVDEGFDLNTDPKNCGMCGRQCNLTTEICQQGGCVTRGETDCNNGVDDDNNGKTDCADSSCNGQSCGPGCQCRALLKAEVNCDDGVDNDMDGKADCEDENCAGAGCFDGGCVCSGGKATETDCSDGIDDDADSASDCLDSDCAGLKCSVDAGMDGNTCANMACSCNGGAPSTEMGVLCRDLLDNDCNGLIDCQEIACDMQSCAPDGGTDCFCVGGAAKENNCADRKDNDNDGTTDCGDSLPDGGGDCPIGTACTFLNTGGMVKAGTCQANHLCEM